MDDSLTTREIDSLGRVVIPVEIRRAFKLEAKSKVDFYIQDGHITIHKHIPSCIFCSSENGLRQISGKMVCKGCIAKIKNL